VATILIEFVLLVGGVFLGAKKWTPNRSGETQMFGRDAGLVVALTPATSVHRRGLASQAFRFRLPSLQAWRHTAFPANAAAPGIGI
jgi:hypothetical protein